MSSVVAIIGRPNVGKSTLFNRLTGKKTAIVHPESGVTRDRNYGEVEWNGKKFFLIDTGGYVPDTNEGFNKYIREQIAIAIKESDKVIFLVDGVSGMHPVDSEILNVLRKNSAGKEIILAVNKIDNENREQDAADFYSLGIGEAFMISALSGRNAAELLDYITRDMELSGEKEETDLRPKFAIVGKPNAGKSSIINAILKQERHIVSDIPGTTRDSVDSVIKYHKQEIVLVDTAGITRKSKIGKLESIDFYSTIRAYKSLQRCDVAIIVVDVTNIFENIKNVPDLELAPIRLDNQDIRILEDAAKYKKGVLVVINKWDLIEKDSKTALLIEKKITQHLSNFSFIKMIFISALTKQRIHKVLEEAMNVYNNRYIRIKTSELNEKLIPEFRKSPPPTARGKEVKINYITQLENAPPAFIIFCNEPKLLGESYKRFIEKKFRQHFPYEGVPLTFIFKKKN
jgi:GTP-binding protein